MFKSKAVRIGIILVFAGVAIYSLLMAKPDFPEKTMRYREQYRRNMISMKDSPVEELAGFTDFIYFEPDPSWLIQAEFTADPAGEAFKMIMTDGSVEQLPVAGKARFTRDGKSFSLLIFDEGETLLLPFRDMTNDRETYGGGRYINLEKTANNRLTIDFNQAHNFYCAYNDRFVCPVPPLENTVELRVEAGEKILK